MKKRILISLSGVALLVGVVAGPAVAAPYGPDRYQVGTTTYTIAGCSMPPPAAGGNGPCVTGQFVTAAVRVRVGSLPVLLQDSQAVCVPTGTGVNIVVTQMRVKGT